MPRGARNLDVSRRDLGDQLATDVLAHAELTIPVEGMVGGPARGSPERRTVTRDASPRVMSVLSARRFCASLSVNPGDVNAVAARGMRRQPTPASSHVQQAVRPVESELVARMPKLLLLRRVDIVRGS